VLASKTERAALFHGAPGRALITLVGGTFDSHLASHRGGILSFWPGLSKAPCSVFSIQCSVFSF